MLTEKKYIKTYTPALFWQLANLPFNLVRLEMHAKRHVQPEKIRFGKQARHYVLFYEPIQTDTPVRGFVLFYHGGGWHAGSPGMFPAVAEFFLRNGFAVGLPGYRLSPRFSFPHMREDIDLALLESLRWLEKRNLSDLKILSAGMSAGANLAAHLAFDRRRLAQLGLDQSLFSGFLGCGGPLDLRQMGDSFVLRNFVGGKIGSEAFYQANPIALIQDSAPLPTLLLHGTADAIVPYGCSLSFLNEYQKIGPVELETMPGKTHVDALHWAAGNAHLAGRVGEWLRQVHSPANIS